MTLTELETLAKAATPGPWFKGSWSGQCHLKHMHDRTICQYEYSKSNSDCVSISNKENFELIGYDDYGTVLNTKDAAYIAAVNPETVLTLIETIRVMREAVTYLLSFPVGTRAHEVGTEALAQADKINGGETE